jgi:putative ABC transport system permease protein
MKVLIKTIIRNFTRNPATNLINLLGLAISMTLVIILSIYCYSELCTDYFHTKGERVYLYGLSEGRIYTPGILKENIDLKIPDVASTVRISGTWEAPVFQVDNKEPLMSDLIFADEDFFKLFTYRFIEGNPETALKDPMSVVITNKFANKLFGTEEALGKNILLNNSRNLIVSAVIQESRDNSCLSFSAIASIATRKIVQYEPGEYTEWGWRDFQTFILLNEGASPDETGKKILALFPEDNKEDFKDGTMTPLKKIYFSKFDLYGSNYLVSGDKKKVQILVLVAVLVLIIALINYSNISSSQWQGKIKQTGIRKIVGAGRTQIFLDILGESFFFFLAAFGISVILVNIITPYIHTYAGIQYNQALTYSPGFIILSLLVIVVLSVIISIVPALRISSSRAADNLKSTVKPDKTDFSFNSIFVTIQFMIAIVLIAFTLLIQKQVRFGSRNLGFNQKNIIGINMTEQLKQKKEVLKNLLMEMPGISEVTFTQYYPGKDISQWGAQLDVDGEKRQVNFYTFSADATTLNIMKLKLITGRFYNEELSSDKGKVVVNETFLRDHNLVNPIGNNISMGTRNFEIIGVVRDFHFQPLTQPISSLVIRNDSFASVCLVCIQNSTYKSSYNTLNKIKETTSGLSPSFPVSVSFFDYAIREMYKSEARFHWIFSLMAGCAILICCLGILAMSLFVCQHRVKEIGIRKVNGAKISEILMMLNKDFVKWVIIALVISAPVAWYIMNKWLHNFAYKTELSLWIFALTGLMVLGIALLTVSWQSWHAATRNPVEALRYE